MSIQLIRSAEREPDFIGLCENSGGNEYQTDPIDLLPADPFSMEPGSNLAAGIAGWIENLNVIFEKIILIDGFYDCEAYSCNENHGTASSHTHAMNYSIDDEEEEDEGIPLNGLILSLAYLGVEDLLSVSRVCKTLHYEVQTNPLLWRCIHIIYPLSQKVDDDALQRLCLKAQGSLECLSLNGCFRITDVGLRNVLKSNPKLQKLNIAGCIRLSLDGLVDNLKAFKTSSGTGIKNLEVGSLFSASSEHYEALKLLVGGDERKKSNTYTPRFYHLSASSIACNNDGHALDIELCARCQKYKPVFDCPSEMCQGKGAEYCRACVKCIERCVRCGRCVEGRKYIENFFMEYHCLDCLEQAPTCNEE